MLAGSALYWREADSIPISPLDGEVNAAAVPKMLATILGVLAVLLVIKTLLTAYRNKRPALSGEKTEPVEGATKETRWGEHARALGLAVIGGLYVALLPVLGYLISVALLIAAIALYMGATFGVRFLGVIIGAAVCFQLLFVQVLHIQLPAGILAQFHF